MKAISLIICGLQSEALANLRHSDQLNEICAAILRWSFSRSRPLSSSIQFDSLTIHVTSGTLLGDWRLRFEIVLLHFHIGVQFVFISLG